jgi:hypothetical protein
MPIAFSPTVLNLLVGCLLRDFWLPTVAGFSANRYGR